MLYSYDNPEVHGISYNVNLQLDLELANTSFYLLVECKYYTHCLFMTPTLTPFLCSAGTITSFAGVTIVSEPAVQDPGAKMWALNFGSIATESLSVAGPVSFCPEETGGVFPNTRNKPIPSMRLEYLPNIYHKNIRLFMSVNIPYIPYMGCYGVEMITELP